MTGPKTSQAAELIQHLNTKYEKVHKRYEDNFWATKMGLQGASTGELARTKTEYEGFLADPINLAMVRDLLQQPDLSGQQRHVLAIMAKTFDCYQLDPKAAQLKEKLNQLEAELAQHRGHMPLGYQDPASGDVIRASSVQLRNTLRTDDDEAVRKACYEGSVSIGPYVVERLCEVVKLRNQLARLLEYEDYYDFKVKCAEGFSKAHLFSILDGLEKQSRPIMDQARAQLAAEKGSDALKPWNMSHALSGDMEKEIDPFFPFEQAVDVWARTFAALGISYKDATMRLDLCDREGKYSNGFCHWPQPAWRRDTGEWVPSAANFTSLATPNAVGSGKTALATLLHEGGHAAHFANIDQPSPFFSQERAPTSVAYAENQSMFLDSLIGDADWQARYAASREGKPIPWELVERKIRSSHPYEVFQLRTMLSVPYFEKALYELPEERVTPDEVLLLAARTEEDIEGGAAPRPLLSVPHILADEASAYYHGYVLAEMAVHQTRAYFKQRYGGKLADNVEVGKALTEVYWSPGNGAAFLDLVQQLTGAPLTADAWVAALQKPTEDKVQEEKKAYDDALATGPAIPAGKEADIGMRIILVHGDEVISDSSKAGGVTAACREFSHWVRKHYFEQPATA